jgi:hypothetical protein
MWRRGDFVWTDVSEESMASIFKVEKSTSEEPAWVGGCSHNVNIVYSNIYTHTYKFKLVRHYLACDVQVQYIFSVPT